MTAAIGLILTCLSVWAVAKLLVFICTHGLPSMLKLRGEAVVEWQDVDERDRHAWDSHVSDAVLLTHERSEEEESNTDAADFLLWADELDDPRIRKYERRMDRWSR